MLAHLTSDPRVLGTLAWVSGLLTLLGIVVAIVQATRAKRAADAARTAAQGMIRLVQNRETLIELTAAQAHLKSAKEYLARGSLEAGGVHVDLLRNALVQARELMNDDLPSRKMARNLVVRLAGVSEVLTRLGDLPSEKRDVMPSVLELMRIGSVLDEIAAHRRYTYEADGVSQ